MPGPAVAAIAGSVASTVMGNRAASGASHDQARAADAQIAESRRQFDLIQGLLQPYVNAGNTGLQAQLDLMGIGGTAASMPTIERIGGQQIPGTPGAQGNFGDWASGAIDGLFGNGRIPGNNTTGATQTGPARFRVNGQEFNTRAEAEAYARRNQTAGTSAEQAQRAAIAKLANGAQFKALAKQGEYGLLANQSATGGLRGGDTQAALAQFRPQMLQSLIDRQLANLGGIAANGQTAANQTGGQAMNTAGMVNQALGDRGAALAGYGLARGQNMQDGLGGILNAYGSFGGGGGGINGNGAWANSLFGGPGLGNLF